MLVPPVLYARQEHGGHRVERGDAGGFTVYWPNGPIAYRSARSTIRALVNREPVVTPTLRDPHLTFDRYFRVGRWRNPTATVDGADAISLFAPTPTVIIPKPKPPGIDLKGRGHEVRKLFFAGFARRVLRYGYDPDEVLQEVYAGLLVRNNGKCPFDPRKSSFGHYVHMVCECIVSNHHRKHNRRAQSEVFGATNRDGEEIDFALSDAATVQADQDRQISTDVALSILSREVEESDGTDVEIAVALRALPMLSVGMSKTEVVARLGDVPKTLAGRAVDLVRRVAKQSDLTV